MDELVFLGMRSDRPLSVPVEELPSPVLSGPNANGLAHVKGGRERADKDKDLEMEREKGESFLT